MRPSQGRPEPFAKEMGSCAREASGTFPDRSRLFTYAWTTFTQKGFPARLDHGKLVMNQCSDIMFHRYLLIVLSAFLFTALPAYAQLNGTYVIDGGGGGDYLDLTSAVADLQTLGVNGPVVMEVADGVHVEQISIPAITGSSAVNTITFRGQSLDSTLAVIRQPSGIGSNYAIQLAGVDHIRFEHLTIERTGVSAGRVIHVLSGSSEWTFSHCQLLTGPTSSNEIIHAAGVSAFGNGIVEYCRARNGTFAELSYCNGGTFRVSHCDIADVLYAIYLASGDLGLVVEHSQLVCAPIGGTRTFNINTCTGPITITNNMIRGASTTYTALLMFNTSGTVGTPILLANNMVLSINSVLSQLTLQGTVANMDVINNTFSTTGSISAQCHALVVGTGGGHRIHNNIYHSSGATFRVDVPSRVTSCDNNIYHSTSTFGVQWGTLYYTTIPDLVAASGMNVNCRMTDPLLVDPMNDLHLGAGSPCAGAGSSWPGIADDVDGEVRPRPVATAPDIGADEDDAACGPMAGTYTIGPSLAADHPDFTSALDRLIDCGISAPVIFEVESGVYVEALQIPAITGTSATNTITFRSQALDSTAVSLEYPTLSTYTPINHVLFFDGGDHIRFEHMTIARTGSLTYGNVIRFGGTGASGDPSQDITFRNDRILRDGTTGIMVYGWPSPATAETGLLFERNRFEGPSQGISFSGNTTDQIVVAENVFSGQSNAITITGVGQLEVLDNRITLASTSTSSGMTLGGNGSISILRNQVITGAAATPLVVLSMVGSAGDPAIVANNALINSGSGNGVRFSMNSQHVRLLHNSISVNSGYGLWMQSASASSDLMLLNNAIRSAASHAISALWGTAFTQADHNVLHSGGTDLVSWNGVTYPDLPALQGGSGMFLNSIEAEPLFLDPMADLHLQAGSPCLGNAQLLPVITDDVDAEGRPQPVASTPDIGADEHPDACSPLAGTYIIGGSAMARFADFTEAVDAMVACGLAGPVVFEVENGTYTEQIVLPNIPGNSNVNTITFRGQAMDSSLAILTWPTGLITPTVLMSGADRVTFEHLTISRTGNASVSGLVVDWENSIADATTRSENITFRNCRLQTASTNYTYGKVVRGIAENDEDQVTFQTCRLEGGYHGIQWSMDVSTLTLEVLGCVFTGQYARSVELFNAGSGDPEVRIEGNTFNGTLSPGSIVLDVEHNTNLLHINGNEIQLSASNAIAMYLDVAGLYPSWTHVRNNMIACTGAAKGMSLSANTTGLGIHYNSISTSSNYGLDVLGLATDCELIGNAIRSATSYALYGISFYVFAEAHHNVLYSGGPYFARRNSFFTDLTCFQQATGQHEASAMVDPMFVSATDLHLQSISPCAGQGMPVPGISIDIEGDTRAMPATSMPDIGADEINGDCTLLAGTYVIGPSATADLPSFTAAVDRLTGCGVAGPVVFEVESGTYTERISIGPIRGSSSVNTVTFRSQALDSTAVILQWPAQTSSANDHVVQLSGGDHLRFEHLTLRRIGMSTYSTVLRFNTACAYVHDLQVGHCVLTNSGNMLNTAALVHRQNTGTTVSLHMEACMLQGGSYAFNWDAPLVSDSLTISGCRRTGGTSGFRILDVTGPVEVHACHLTGTTNADVLLIGDCTGPITVTKNRVDGGSGVIPSGIYLTGCAPLPPARALVANNHITYNGGFGIRLNGIQQRIDVVHNSTHMSAGGAYGLFMAGTGTNISVHDNILSTASGYAVFNTMSGITMDHNCLYRASAGPPIYWNGAPYTTIAAWNTGTGSNANSMIRDPHFFDPLTDLHVYAMELNGAGLPFASVTTDIDGAPRDPATPDIGCDEFTPELWQELFDVCHPFDPIQSNGSGMPQYIYADRKVVGAINDNGNVLGTIQGTLYIHTGAVRQSAIGQYYMDRNWRIEAQYPVTGANVDLRLYYHADEFAALALADPAVNVTTDAGVSQYDGPNENCQLADNTAVGDYFLHYPTPTGPEDAIAPLTQVGYHDAVLAQFSEFYITTLGLPLPVELIHFQGERLDMQSVRLDWSTATELDNAGFEIWRRDEDALLFDRVGWVDGAGTSQQRTDYQFIDPNRNEGITYYHLRQYDHNGTFEDSPVIAVNGTGRDRQLVLYPNPAGDRVHIQGDLSDVTGVEMFDQHGRLVRSWPVLSTLDLTAVRGGVYTVRITRSDGSVVHERLVVR